METKTAHVERIVLSGQLSCRISGCILGCIWVRLKARPASLPLAIVAIAVLSLSLTSGNARADDSVFSGSSEFEFEFGGSNSGAVTSPPATVLPNAGNSSSGRTDRDRHRHGSNNGLRRGYGYDYDRYRYRSRFNDEYQTPEWYLRQRPSLLQAAPPAPPETFSMVHPLMYGIALERAPYRAARQLIAQHGRQVDEAVRERSDDIRAAWQRARTAREAGDLAASLAARDEAKLLLQRPVASEALVNALLVALPAEHHDALRANAALLGIEVALGIEATPTEEVTAPTVAEAAPEVIVETNTATSP